MNIQQQVKTFTILAIMAITSATNATENATVNLIQSSTQMDMNQDAKTDQEHAEKNLTHYINQLKKYYSKTEQKQFEEVNTAWRAYQKKNAEFQASFYKGGTLYPTVYQNSMSETAIARADELGHQLHTLQETRAPQ